MPLPVQALATAAPPRPGPVAFLDMAVVQVAVYDAVQAIDQGSNRITWKSREPCPTGRAAAKAAHDVLVNILPGQTASLDTIYHDYLTAHGLLWASRQQRQHSRANPTRLFSMPGIPSSCITGFSGMSPQRKITISVIMHGCWHLALWRSPMRSSPPGTASFTTTTGDRSQPSGRATMTATRGRLATRPGNRCSTRQTTLNTPRAPTMRSVR